MKNPSRTSPSRRRWRGEGWRWAASLVLLGVTLLFAANCTDQAPGIAPDPGHIHYPIGIAVHPSGQYLYVANSNFDLAFTGGSVMVFNTDENLAEPVPVDVAGVKTELKTLKMLSAATVEIGSFAGQMLLNPSGTRAYLAVRQDRKKDIPIDTSTITMLNIDPSKEGAGHLSCSEEAVPKEKVGGVGEEDKFEQDPVPRCGDNSKIFLEDNPYPYSMALVSACQAKRTCQQDSDCVCSQEQQTQGVCQRNQRCDFGRCVVGCTPTSCKQGEQCIQGRCRTTSPTGKACSADSECGVGQRCDSGKCAPGCARNLDCPTSQRCLEGRCRTPLPSQQAYCADNTDCPAWESCNPTRLLATHIERGGLSEISLRDKDKDQPRKISNVPSLPSGITSLALLPPNNVLGLVGNIFLTSNQNNNIYVLPNQLPPADDSIQSIPFVNTDGNNTNTVTDLRGVTVGYDRKNQVVRLFVASRRPTPAVLIYRLDTTDTNELTATLQRFVTVGTGPAHLVYHRQAAPKPNLLYVVCSQEGRIDVINTETLQVIHKIKVGEQPAFLALYDPPAGAAISRRRAYVSNFLDSTVSIIDLNTYRVIGRISGIDTRLPLP